MRSLFGITVLICVFASIIWRTNRSYEREHQIAEALRLSANEVVMQPDDHWFANLVVPSEKRKRITVINFTDRRLPRPLIEQLPSLPKLCVIYATGSDLSDDDCEIIARIPELKDFIAADTPMGDRGLSELVKCPRLEALLIVETRVSTKGLELLKHCKSLKELEVNAETLGDVDEGNAILRSLESLEVLEIFDFPATPREKRDAARKAFPDLQIRWTNYLSPGE